MKQRSLIHRAGAPALWLSIAAAAMTLLFLWGGGPAAAQGPADDYTYVLFEGGNVGQVRRLGHGGDRDR